jgi:Flp pilus assembly protein TadB
MDVNGERRRPAWQSSLGWAVFMFVIAAAWAWFAITALRAGVYGLAAVSAVICVLGVVAGLRVLRRRSRDGGRAGA